MNGDRLRVHRCRASLLLVFGAILALLGGCAGTRPWINEALKPDSVAIAEAQQVQRIAARDPSLLVAVTLSGGGARAAAFGYGVLRELQDTTFEWNGRSLDLLDATDVIAGVSGGSIIAAYYAAFGAEGLDGFEQDFLYRNFQNSLVLQTLSPANLYRLTSPWFGRSHLLAQRLDELLQGRTFGDVMRRPRHPQLLISATDLTQGAVFEFTAEQFELICSDIESVPLSFAVAASSSVPLLLSPMTLHNHSRVCRQQGIPQRLPTMRDDSYRSRLYALQQKSYLDAEARPYIHLVDGGVADNLGVRRLLDRALAGSGFRDSFHEVQIPPGSVRRVVLITVNSERDPSEHIDASDETPGNLRVLNALRFGTGSRATHETQGFLVDLARQWGREPGAGAPGREIFATAARIHVVQVNLRDAADEERGALLQVPTALSLDPRDVEQLIAAGRTALRRSTAFQALREDLQASSPKSARSSLRDRAPEAATALLP